MCALIYVFVLIMTLFFAGETLSPEDIQQSKKMKLDMKVRETDKVFTYIIGMHVKCDGDD